MKRRRAMVPLAAALSLAACGLSSLGEGPTVALEVEGGLDVFVPTDATTRADASDAHAGDGLVEADVGAQPGDSALDTTPHDAADDVSDTGVDAPADTAPDTTPPPFDAGCPAGSAACGSSCCPGGTCCDPTSSQCVADGVDCQNQGLQPYTCRGGSCTACLGNGQACCSGGGCLPGCSCTGGTCVGICL